MNLKKKAKIVIIFLLLSIYFPLPCFAEQNHAYTKEDKAATITRHQPGFLAPPELEIPVETQKSQATFEKRKTNKWLWIGVGVVVAGTIAALSINRPDDKNVVRDGSSGGEETGTIEIVGPAP